MESVVCMILEERVRQGINTIFNVDVYFKILVELELVLNFLNSLISFHSNMSSTIALIT